MKSDRNSISVRVWLTMASVFAAWAILANTVSAVNYRAFIIQAIGCSVISLMLIAFTWRRMSIWARVVFALVGLMMAWTLLDAAGRRLPAEMGW